MSPLTRGARMQMFTQLGPQLCRHFRRCLSSAPDLDLQYEDDVAVITMRCGDNRLNTHFLEELDGHLTSVEQNKTCKGLITTGGGKVYSNGIDLDWLKSASGAELQAFVQKLNHVTARILLFPVPTMAVLNGHAFAGGAALATAHDLRTMNSDKGWLSFNEVFLKIPPTNFLTAMCRAKLGVSVSDLFVLGARFTAADALRHNMIHAACPAASLVDDSKRLLQGYLGKGGLPRGGVSLMKQQMYQSASDGLKVDEAENFGPISQRITQLVATMP